MKNFYLFLLVLIAPDKNFSVTQIGVTLQVIHSTVWMLSRLFFCLQFLEAYDVSWCGCLWVYPIIMFLWFAQLLESKDLCFFVFRLMFCQFGKFFQVLFHKVVFQSYPHLFSLQNSVTWTLDPYSFIVSQVWGSIQLLFPQSVLFMFFRLRKFYWSVFNSLILSSVISTLLLSPYQMIIFFCYCIFFSVLWFPFGTSFKKK